MLGYDFIKMISNGYLPIEYYKLGLYEKSIDGYISIRQGIRLEKLMNERMTGVINFDKWQQYCFFKANELSVPEVYGVLMGARGLMFGVVGETLASDFKSVMARIPTPFAVKPYDGAHGDGFCIVNSISLEANEIVFRGKGSEKLDRWLLGVVENKHGLLLQELISSHSALHVFGSSALNTIRLVTVRDSAGAVHPVAALLKMARVDSLVDNIGAGAIAAHIDFENGRLSEAFSWPREGLWTSHPDTGAVIEGFEVPFWREAISLAINAHERLTSGSSLSWDVAITDRGPVLLEMNAFVPRPVYQKLDRGLMCGVYGNVVQQRGFSI
jgi:hypothetical protein